MHTPGVGVLSLGLPLWIREALTGMQLEGDMVCLHSTHHPSPSWGPINPPNTQTKSQPKVGDQWVFGVFMARDQIGNAPTMTLYPILITRSSLPPLPSSEAPASFPESITRFYLDLCAEAPQRYLPGLWVPLEREMHAPEERGASGSVSEALLPSELWREASFRW